MFSSFFCHELLLLFLKQNAILPYFGISLGTEKTDFCQTLLQSAAALWCVELAVALGG